MFNVDQADTSCDAFNSITGGQSGSIVRFIVGLDTEPRVLTRDEAADLLADPFAIHVLLHDTFPTTADEVIAALDAAVGDDPTLGSASQRSFLVGEGGQLPTQGDDVESTNRGLRFLVSRGSAPHGPELVISASRPDRGLVELMAWDERQDGFNYYRTLDMPGQWVFAGNSRHALSAPTQGKGPFESHPSGNLLMKELKLPWLHWHSFRAEIFDSAFDEVDGRVSHAWFVDKDGAETCETAVVMPSINRWTSARLDKAVAADGTIPDPARIIEQIVTTSTVNLVTSKMESEVAVRADAVDLPPTFFVDADALRLLGLPGPPPLSVPGATYADSLVRFGFVLRDGDGFEQAGDTHFAFVVPERAFEDLELLRQAVGRGVLTDRLAATLLMVDFPNPVFSTRRAVLLQHAPASGTAGPDAGELSAQYEAAIESAAATAPAGSPEQEFASLWTAGDGWREAFAQLLMRYYDALRQHLATDGGFDDYVRLAEARRNRVRQMPIFETRLLFPETNLPDTPLLMRPDGSVGDG